MNFTAFLKESKKYDSLLAKQASYYNDFSKFSFAYSNLNLRPIYWHWTNDSKFSPNPHYNPKDAIGGFKGVQLNEPIGSLMACAVPTNWTKNMLGIRNYLVMLDISDLIPDRSDVVGPKDFVWGSRGFDEINIPAKAFYKLKIIKIYDAEFGKKAARRIWNEFPVNENQLRAIYEKKILIESIENLQIHGPFPDTDTDLYTRSKDSLMWLAIIPNAQAWGVPPTYEQRNLVGWISASKKKDGIYYVGTVNTHPDFQRQGISSKLHDAAFQYLNKQGFEFHSGSLSPKNKNYWEKIEKNGQAKKLPLGLGGQQYIRIS